MEKKTELKKAQLGRLSVNFYREIVKYLDVKAKEGVFVRYGSNLPKDLQKILTKGFTQEKIIQLFIQRELKLSRYKESLEDSYYGSAKPKDYKDYCQLTFTPNLIMLINYIFKINKNGELIDRAFNTAKEEIRKDLNYIKITCPYEKKVEELTRFFLFTNQIFGKTKEEVNKFFLDKDRLNYFPSFEGYNNIQVIEIVGSNFSILDLSKFKNLEKVILNSNSRITTLNIKGLKKLKVLKFICNPNLKELKINCKEQKALIKFEYDETKISKQLIAELQKKATTNRGNEYLRLNNKKKTKKAKKEKKTNLKNRGGRQLS